MLIETIFDSCLCNTRVHHRADYSVCVRAQTGIKKGEEVSFEDHCTLYTIAMNIVQLHNCKVAYWHIDKQKHKFKHGEMGIISK